MTARIDVDPRRIDDFCRHWGVCELAFFGSVLTEDFRSDSDVDVLISWSEDASWTLLDHFAMEEELSGILGRKVDLISRRAVERSQNWIRRKAILESAETFYVGG